jgi:CBS domain-containing protein
MVTYIKWCPKDIKRFIQYTITMNAIDLVKREPIYVKKGTPAIEAVRLMSKANTGLVVIIDETGKVSGVVSERDIIRAMADGIDPSTPVDRIGTMGSIVKVHEKDPILKVAALMAERNVRHVVVVDDDNKLRGVISIRDLLREYDALKELARKPLIPQTKE